MALSPGKGTTGRRYEVSSQATSSSNIALVVKRATARTAEGAGGDIAMALVRARLMERLRSQEKGIYTLETSWKQFHDPDYLLISIRFSSLPENADRLIAAAQQELEKLKLTAPDGKADLATVQASLGDSARFDVFQLGDAALAGDVTRALRILAGLRSEGVEPVLVLWSLAREIRNTWGLSLIHI